MSQNIDLSQQLSQDVSPQDVWIPSREPNMWSESYIDIIQPGLQPLNLVYSNVSEANTIGPMEQDITLLFYSMLQNDLKTFFLKKKVGCFLLFNGIVWEKKKSDKRVWRLQTDIDAEYDF